MQNVLTRHNEIQISILGSAYFQPIADLIDHMLSHGMLRSNAVQSGYFENGYAASIVLLLVAMFESYVVRARFVLRPRDVANRCPVVNVLLRLYPKLPNKKALEDVYVLRDAIFHNHLWEIEYSISKHGHMIYRKAAKDPDSGDRKHAARVNPSTRRTKTLKLHAVPTCIDRQDVKKVFATLWTLLIFLESKNRNQCYVSHVHVKYRRKRILFSELLEDLRLVC